MGRDDLLTRTDMAASLAARERELRYQRAIASCARTLMAPDSPAQLDQALRAILDAADVTHVFVEANVEDDALGPCTKLIHEVSTGRYAIDWQRWGLVPWSALPDSYALLSQGKPAMLHVDRLGEIEKATYADTPMVVEVNHPIIVNGRWAGIVGFAHSRIARTWDDDVMRLLKATADLFAHLWERQERQRQLEEAIAEGQRRQDYERALASCSQRLLSGTDERGLEAALDSLLLASSASFGTIERNMEDPELGWCTQTLCLSSRPDPDGPVIHVFDEYWNRVPWSRMPDTFARLSQGEAFGFRVSELGPVERKLYQEAPVSPVAEMDIPIMVDGEWRGLIAFGYMEKDRLWNQGDVALLQTAADMVGAYWMRQDAQDRLEALVRSKDEFLVGVSHELRTPLTVVLGLAEELRDRVGVFTAVERAELTALIAQESLEMAHLVEDLLVAARADVGRIDVASRPIDVAVEIDHVVGAMRSAEAICVETPGPCPAVGDAVRVRQVLRNLLTNAVRHGGPSITAACRTDGDWVRVMISDDGPAIADDARDRIFEPYERAHHEPSQPASVGLGLSLSRSLARLMGGDIVYRRDGAVNMFVLSLPGTGPAATP